MDRRGRIERVRAGETWDLVVIGGGATGLGTAVDAASRGYRTLLLDAYDFAKGTSGRSTKLVHGGVRYLARGDVAMVREALRERGRLRSNAPHLVHSGPHEAQRVAGDRGRRKVVVAEQAGVADVVDGARRHVAA